MEPGSQRSTSELNSALNDLSGERCLTMGWLDIQHRMSVPACISGLYGLPTVGDAFVNNQWTHVSGDAEGGV